MAKALPEEIILEEIVPKLPAIQMPRFIRVSETFNAAISSSQFPAKHLRHSLLSDANRLLIVINQVNHWNDGVHFFDLESPELSPKFLLFPDTFKTEHPPPPGRYNDKQFAFIVGSANGLLLLGRRCRLFDNPDFLLINPCTETYSVFPPQNLVSTRNGLNCHLGFGYDRFSDGYKFVTVVSGTNVLIYSLKAKSWKLANTTRNPLHRERLPLKHSFAAVVNGLLHWPIWGSKDQGEHPVIARFDLCLEDWVDDVPLPDSHDFDLDFDSFELGILGGCLCSTTRPKSEGFESCNYDVWVMKKYGVRESWVKLLTFSDDVTSFAPLTYRRGTMHDILVHKGMSVRWWNTRSRRYSNKGSFSLAKHGINRLCQAHVCMGSLVHVPDGVRLPKAE